MATMYISLPEQMRSWVPAQIEAGKYSSSSNYIRDPIRQDQECRVKMHAHQKAITEGIESGEAEDFDFKAFKKAMLAKTQ